MNLTALDWAIIAAFFGITILIGLLLTTKKNQTTTDYFLGGRHMSWWLLGVSMVATTFSADTPNLVTDIVRNNGVMGNWVWWAFLLTGMLTVFLYARLWRRSGIATDLEFYELRYSGTQARFLRGFRAIYLGVFFNVMIMATVMLAGIKISGILMGYSALETVLLVSVITVIYSSVGGFKGVIYTDFFQFALAMFGMVWACIYILNLPEIGGLDALLQRPEIQGKLQMLPSAENFNGPELDTLLGIFIIPVAVQWWSVWYPGAEPGGGGYIAQRMLSARDEKEAVWATLLFNVAHYALRPWPWILIALASMIVFPDLPSIAKQFPNIENSFIGHDLAFPAMLSLLPSGLLGIVIASLLSALMSTISTHLNWGSSYVVNDFYQRFVKPEASQKELIIVGRISTVLLMLVASLFALALTSALQAFNILLQVGAGTGLLFILRWFWWRINPVSELVAMFASFFWAVIFEFVVKNSMSANEKMLTGILLTTVCWVIATIISKPTDMETLVRFYNLIKPQGKGWKPVIEYARTNGLLQADSGKQSTLTNGILLMIFGSLLVYSLLFGTGFMIYGDTTMVMIALAVALVSGYIISILWKKSAMH